jgi:hypothetical protein
MSRTGKELELEKEKQIESGFLVCKTCNELKPLYYFNRQMKNDKTYYKNKKCKVCVTGKEPKLYKTSLEGKIREYKTLKIKNDIRLSLEAKEFIKRVIFMKGYIDNLEMFKLVDHHINTFGHNERLITNPELELTIMFIELLEVYYKCDTHRVKL